MARFPYMGTETRQYTQYLQLDAVTDAKKDITGPRMLEAEPGGVYEIGVAPGYVTVNKKGEWVELLPIPPGDGRWGDAIDGKKATAKKDTSAIPATEKGASA